MSLYRVEYQRDTPEEHLREAGKIMWDWAEFPSKHFPDIQDYLARVCDDSWGLPSIVAFRGDWFCGGMTITEPSTDSHLPGIGRYILNIVAHPMEVGATEAMFQHFKRMLRQEGADWYQITKRVSELEFRTQFRRLGRGLEA